MALVALWPRRQGFEANENSGYTGNQSNCLDTTDEEGQFVRGVALRMKQSRDKTADKHQYRADSPGYVALDSAQKLGEKIKLRNFIRLEVTFMHDIRNVRSTPRPTPQLQKLRFQCFDIRIGQDGVLINRHVQWIHPIVAIESKI